jgi:hypothetical protein
LSKEGIHETSKDKMNNRVTYADERDMPKVANNNSNGHGGNEGIKYSETQQRVENNNMKTN